MANSREPAGPPGPGAVAPARQRRRREVLLWTAGCVLAALALGSWLPLPRGEAPSLPGYAGIDNRRLLLRWAILVGAVLLGPLVAAIRNRSEPFGRPADKSMETDPPSVAGTVAGFSGGIDPPKPVHPAWFLFAALLAAFLFIGPGISRHEIGGHELIHFGYLGQIGHGDLLNVETRVVYGPLLGYSIFAFMKLVSFSVFGFRLYWNVVAAVTLVVLLWVLARHVRNRSLLPLCFLYLALLTTAFYYLPGRNGLHGGHWGWGNVLRHAWAPLLILAFAPGRREGPGLVPWALAGAGVMLGTFYAQETGPPALVAVLVFLGLASGASGPGLLARRFLSFGAGAVLAFLVVVFPAILRGRGIEFLEATFQAPALLIRGAANLPYPDLLDPRAFRSALPFYVLPAAVLGLLCLEWNAFLSRSRPAGPGLPIALYGALSFVSVLVRADPSHLRNVTAAPIVGAFLYLDHAWWRASLSPRTSTGSGTSPADSARSARRLRLARAAVLLGVFLPIAVTPFFRDLAVGSVARIRSWRAPALAGWTRVTGPRGGIWVPADNWYDAGMTPKRDSAAGMRMIGELAAGRPVYIVGRKASLQYFLSGASCAVPYTDAATTCWTRADQEQLVATLEKSPPPYVFVEEEYATEAQSRGRGAPGYRLLGLHRGFYVFQRDDLAPVSLADGASEDVRRP